MFSLQLKYPARLNIPAPGVLRRALIHLQISALAQRTSLRMGLTTRRTRTPKPARLARWSLRSPAYIMIVMRQRGNALPDRREQKALAREADRRALASGAKSRDDLRRENGYFAFPNARIEFANAKLY